MNDQTSALNPVGSNDTGRNPLSRRTVLAGSAFAVPAIVLTAGTPAFAASGLTLAFDKSSYSGQACSAITGIQVFARSSGVGRSGVPVTVSLADGYTFNTGGTTYTGTTDTNGSVALPDVKVPQNGGTSTATATSAGASSASATLTGTVPSDAKYLQNGTLTAASGVPNNSTPVQAAVYLTSDGRLMDTGNVLATNVASVGQLWHAGSGWWVGMKKKDGSVTYIQNGTEKAATGVPSGSAPVAGGIFLASDGRLIDAGVGGTVYATNVSSFGQIYQSGNTWYLPLKKKDGSNTYIQNGTEKAATGVPSGSTPAAAAIFITTDGRLFDVGTGGLVYATNVSSIGELFSPNNGANWRIPVKKNDGSISYIDTRTEKATTGVPSGSTPVAYATFLTTDGRIIDGSTGTVYANDVDFFGRIYSANSDSNWRLPLRIKHATC